MEMNELKPVTSPPVATNETEVINNLRARLDDCNSDYYKSMDHLFCPHETSDKRLEKYFIENFVELICEPFKPLLKNRIPSQLHKNSP